MSIQAVRDALAKNRRDAIDIASAVGGKRVRGHLEDAQKDLVARLERLSPGMRGTFTEAQMKSALAQVRDVLTGLTPGMRGTIVQTGLEAATDASNGVVEYLTAAEQEFRGVGAQSLALDEASMMDSARFGAKASILRRIGSSGEDVPGAEGAPHMAKRGVLQRYGMNVIGYFEQSMRTAIVTRKPWESIKQDITEKSPFLQQAPASWAERIVRTECASAYNTAGLHATEDANEQLGDMVKILSATFDDRTASDSYAVHGQIRRINEMFDTWYGPMAAPPARPNDREIVVPHRISWPIPRYLFPRTRAEVVQRWTKEKRKGPPPPTPNDSTVPRRSFGKQEPPKIPGE